MTRHFILQEGCIRELLDGAVSTERIESIKGRIYAILSCGAKRCFVFRDGDDLNRFYLDHGYRPEARLLILMTSRISWLRDSEFVITSVQGNAPGQSRLHIRFVSQDEEGEAPYVLPRNYAARNEERIRMILAALVYAAEEDEPSQPEEQSQEQTNGDAVRMTAGEVAEHAPIVLGGLAHVPAGVGVSAVDARAVALVKNFPLTIIIVKDSDIRDEEDAVAQVSTNPNITVESASFTTAKEREAFLNGFKSAGSLAIGYSFFPITDREKVNAVLQAYANRDDES